ncbi:lipopolysaccharide biosynthesis protein [Rhizobium oryzicola]|uniref:Polysaccharide biosynthesis C-terminal domain-containing protein n=1 Tax=Rhizobium oryzicola TaxID=1232668 RepID=A0ABT8SWH8_9HYPH|nr:polysaccharide biosynthesis C-terminal domain-containing protein [Rhizobium oryzicola]MDO1582793.1 polysaccharide biosynthesis C-terminal domain-containing protein [Rhizobium oryzicola]
MLLRSTLIYGPATLFTRLGGLLFVVVATRLLDQNEYGILTLVVTVGELIDLAVTEWMRIAFLRLGGKGEISRRSLLQAGRILGGTTFLAFLLAAPASLFVLPERWLEFFIAICVYLLASAMSRFSLLVLQLQQRHAAYMLFEFLRALLQLIFPLVTMITHHNSFLAVSIASNLGTFVAGLAAGVIAMRQVVDGPSRFTSKEFFALGLPIIAIVLVSFGLHSVERVVLNEFHGAASVAVFAAIFSLARQPINTIANAVNTGSFPEAVSRFDEIGPEAASALFTQVMALIISLSLPAAALLIALSGDLVKLVLPPDYGGQHAVLFAIISLNVIIANVTSFVFNAMVHAHKRPQLLIINTAIGSVVGLSLCSLLIPTLSEVGAALALAGGAIGNLIVSVIISNRLTPIAVPWRAIASAVLVSLGTAGAAMLATQELYFLTAPWRLALASVAGGVVFLSLNAALHPKATLEKTAAALAFLSSRRKSV